MITIANTHEMEGKTIGDAQKMEKEIDTNGEELDAKDASLVSPEVKLADEKERTQATELDAQHLHLIVPELASNEEHAKTKEVVCTFRIATSIKEPTRWPQRRILDRLGSSSNLANVTARRSSL